MGSASRFGFALGVWHVGLRFGQKGFGIRFTTITCSSFGLSSRVLFADFWSLGLGLKVTRPQSAGAHSCPNRALCGLGPLGFQTLPKNAHMLRSRAGNT